MPNLNPKQQRFVSEYLKDQNATQAAVRAGYEFDQPDGYYAYLLVDPRNGQVFYIGKGVRRRMATHARLARAGRVDNAEKFRRIAAIHAAGSEVVELVFTGGLSERDALAVEKELIAALKDCGLTNISGGNCTNAERLEEVVAAFKRNCVPELIWRLTASPAQRAWVEKNGGFKAVRSGLFRELDEALALSK
jgi:hypothetical protein